MNGSRNDKPALVIMAAGMGSRFGGLKQMAPIGKCGEPILAFSLHDARKAGFRKFVFVIKEEMETDFRALITDKLPKDCEASLVFQKLTDIPDGFAIPEGRVKPWGTGHAILTAAPVLRGPFAVINSDDYYGPNAFGPVYQFLETAKPGSYCMMAYLLKNTLSENGAVTRGVCGVKNNMLAEITETYELKKDGEEAVDQNGKRFALDTPVSMNFWGFSPDFLDALEKGFPEFLEKALNENPLKGEYLLPTMVDSELKKGATVTVLCTDDRWFGVTYKEDLAFVQNALQAMQTRGLYPDKLL